MTKDLPRSESLLSTTSSINEEGRQRKADMSAAAAAAMVAAAKASKRSAALKLSSDPASLGKELVQRVDTRAIHTVIENIILRRKKNSPLDASLPSVGESKAESMTSSIGVGNEEAPHCLFTPEIQRQGRHRPIAIASPPTLTVPSKTEHAQVHNHNGSSLSERHVLKREAAVDELITTEESYCRDLDILVNHFFKGIRDAKCLPDTTLDRLMRNADDILQFQIKFMEALHQSSVVLKESLVDERVINIAQCFCEWGDKFQVYIDYCMYHDKACALHKDIIDTNAAFVSTLEKLHISKPQEDGNGRRKFDDYLIMPVQRLFKYKLMLESILKTTQSDSEEHNALLKALKVMHGVAINLNSKKSIMEAERKTRLFMNRIESDWVNAASKRFYGLLGSCLLIGTLDVRAWHEGSKVKRLGCALFKSYMIIVKAKKYDKYEPRHWFPLRIFDLEHLPDDHSSSYHTWFLRNEQYTIEFGAMCDQEKHIWMDALRGAIQSSKENAIDGHTPSNAIEELFVSSLNNVTPSTVSTAQIQQQPHISSSTTSLSSYVSRTETTTAAASGIDKPDTPHTTASNETLYDDSPTHSASAQSSMLNSPGMRSHASFGDFYDFVTHTVADIRIQRRHQQHNVRCTNIDNKFEDVSTTPILTARTQARHDRYSGGDQWKRKSRMGKSASMLAFTNIAEEERIQQQQPQARAFSSAMSSPRDTNKYGMTEAFKSAVRRKASLPSRLRMSESMILDDITARMATGSAPPAMAAQMSAIQPALPNSTNDQMKESKVHRKRSTSSNHQPPPVNTESMIFKLSRRGSSTSNHVNLNNKKTTINGTAAARNADLPPTPGLQRSFSAATMGFARSSSKFFGRVVEKLGTISTPRRARRCATHLSDKTSTSTTPSFHSTDISLQNKTSKKPKRALKKPPPLLIPESPVTRPDLRHGRLAQ
ncbi:hypothetical protein K492DRAFT_200158 [Lichtheimia hyalospora FSU 10163]|nr:hypothetical protein K492DRAFT_200158 [Lichtheimia hyalospora FSU 10163]